MKALKCLIMTVTMAALPLSAIAVEKNYPEKPVKIIVPYQPGQGTDIATRFFAEHLSKTLGQNFYVENLGGAGGNIGTEKASRAEPDGYTLVMGTNATHALNAFMYSSPGFDPRNDFDPVSLVGTFPMVLLTTPESKFDTVTDIIETVKTSADKADIGMPSTTARLVYELLKNQSGAPLFGIPYKGSSMSMTNLIGGDIPISIDTIMAAQSHLSANRIRPIAVTSLEETNLLPGVPTASSQGLEGFEVIAWNGIFAPKGTPKPIIEKLNRTLDEFLELPETKQRLLTLGYDAGGGSPERLANLVESESKKWEPVIKQANIKFD